MMRVKLTIPTIKLGATRLNILSTMVQRPLREVFGSSLVESRIVQLENGAFVERAVVNLPEAPAEISLDLGAVGLLSMAGDGTPDARQLRLLLPMGLSGWLRDQVKPAREERAQRTALLKPHFLFWLNLKPGHIINLPLPSGTVSVELL